MSRRVFIYLDKLIVISMSPFSWNSYREVRNFLDRGNRLVEYRDNYTLFLVCKSTD